MIQALIYAGTYLILILTRQINRNKIFGEIFSYIVNFSLLILFLITHVSGEIVNGLIIALSALVINIIYELMKNKEDNISGEHYLQPFKILLFGYAILDYIIPELAFTWHLLFGSLITLLFFFIIKEQKLKFTYFIVYFMVSILVYLSNINLLHSYNYEISVIAPILAFIACLIPFYITQIKKEQYEKFDVVTFILILLSIFSFIFNEKVFIMQETAKSLTVLAIYIILIIAYRNRKVLYTLSSLATMVPFNILISNMDLSYSVDSIVRSAFYLTLIPLLCRNVPKLQERDLLLTIFYSLIMYNVIFIDGLEIGLYVGFVALLLILFGFINKDYKSIFMLGIILTALNIIFQLRELWIKIPFWLYLLVAGMILIGLVMYKGIKKMNK
jgi:hypothetical protein